MRNTKNIIISLFLLMIFATVVFAQAPQKFSYQAVVRDAAGNLVSNAPVGVRVSILKSAADGVAVYCETHLNNTNATGLLLLEIGGGTVVGGDFTSIDWANGPYFLKTEMDVTGGTHYTMTSSQQLLSVPYALYAGNAIDMEERMNNMEKQLDSLKQEALVSFSLSIPVVNTFDVTSINSYNAECGGVVIWEGYTPVDACGVCWSTTENPTVADNKTVDGKVLGRFTSSITGLTANTTYYVRAYATNRRGTAYGEQKSFTTARASAFTCGTSTASDYDNNTYNTVQIGEQCWMKENLKTTHYSDGTSISLGSSTSTSTAYCYYPDNDSSNVSTYGLLYNWKAVMRNETSSESNPSKVQGICPTGWHVPSDAEWTQLENYASSQSEYECGSDTTYIAKALASTTGWKSYTSPCAVGNNPSSNNATGFSVVPAGGYFDSFDGFGCSAGFWSATPGSSGSAYYRNLSYYDARVSRGNGDMDYAYSVRCLRD